MTKSLLPLSLALALTGGALFAQDTTPTQDAAPAEATTDAPATQDAPADLSMGVTVGEDGAIEPQPGQVYARETYGDWTLRCVRAEEGADACQLYQLLSDENDNAVAEISMFPLSGKGQAKAGATIVVPLETLLSVPLKLSVDGGKDRAYPYTFCNQGGCVSRVGFTQADVEAFKAGAEATLKIVPAVAPDQVVALKISLNGFTAGIAGVPQE